MKKRTESIMGMAFFGPALVLLYDIFIPADDPDIDFQFY